MVLDVFGVFIYWFGVFISWCGPVESFNWLLELREVPCVLQDTHPPGMEETLRKLGESVSFRKAISACVFALGMFDRKWRDNG